MPHPKQRHSKQRTRTRRSHHALEQPHVMNCSNCGAPVLRHRVCTECGFYRGKVAIDKSSEN
ncbi:MAG: 50S ribosomal protein L32 [Chitinophagales bacterium]|nr:50S ribosomal protein L32 [Chitinophagales bacterium]HAE14751.1 50S ribosomal protein L32 [Bacteroidota bacterium]MCB9019040.1 50S ribosomal protein L32 [Chitinophagales bacterium]MCB9022443.1 50S ribosomal protein L32 [Chitinophagales bacterium]HPE97428.1 50S ribosomal protein L32 [Chitinophagales bacterium]